MPAYILSSTAVARSASATAPRLFAAHDFNVIDIVDPTGRGIKTRNMNNNRATVCSTARAFLYNKSN